MFTARTRDMPQEPKQNDQMLLYAVANSFKRAIEVYHAGKLDASIVRPALALQHNTVHTLCLGFDGRDHYVSLRPFEDENGFEMIDIPTEQQTEDPQDIQEQGESFGEHQTPNSINNETSQIQVILSNGKTIDVNIRTTEQPPVQNGHEFAERLLINIEVDTRTKTPEEVEQYEEDIVSNLKKESGAEELHRIADRHGLEFELAKKECVCLYFKVKDAKLALAFLQKRKIRNEYISNILKFIMNLSSIDGQFPDIVNVSINPQFNVQDTDACPKQYFARKNAFTSSKHVSDDKEDTAMSTVSTGISFVFKRTRSHSTPLRAQGIELSEELANFLQERRIRDISNMHLEIEHFCFHEAKPCAGDPSEVLQVVGDMVVRIRTMFGPSGTAFRIGTDYLITAKHVLLLASFESLEETDYANVEALFKDEDQPRKVKIVYASGYLDIAILKICEIVQKPLKKLETPVAVTFLEPGQPFYLVVHSSWKKQAVEKTVAIANKFSPNANPTFECFHSEKFVPGSSGVGWRFDIRKPSLPCKYSHWSTA
ncbi:uncharacterized protein LOC128209663 [Mya arenaria]|uniref:uncharacterized protein LOC128209663 n=1 Tax=Mya arenaria TaxID=6604 RepID=UPI0022E555EC|nr:uncharacterized protein LOC128209663 [Mya arenaria]